MNVAHILESAGIQYRMRPDGSAGFRIQGPHGPPISFAAKIRGHVCQFAAETEMGATAAENINQWNLNWGWGRFWQVDGRLHASVSLYLGTGGPHPYEIRQMIDGLHAGLYSATIGGFQHFAEDYPQQWPSAAIPDVVALLDQAGVPLPPVSQGAWGGVLEIAPGIRIRTRIALSSTCLCFLGFMVARSNAEALTRWNAVLPAGTLASASEEGICFLLDLPMAWTPFDAAAIRWALDSLTSALEDYAGIAG